MLHFDDLPADHFYPASGWLRPVLRFDCAAATPTMRRMPSSWWQMPRCWAIRRRQRPVRAGQQEGGLESMTASARVRERRGNPMDVDGMSVLRRAHSHSRGSRFEDPMAPRSTTTMLSQRPFNASHRVLFQGHVMGCCHRLLVPDVSADHRRVALLPLTTPFSLTPPPPAPLQHGPNRHTAFPPRATRLPRWQTRSSARPTCCCTATSPSTPTLKSCSSTAQCAAVSSASPARARARAMRISPSPYSHLPLMPPWVS